MKLLPTTVEDREPSRARPRLSRREEKATSSSISPAPDQPGVPVSARIRRPLDPTSGATYEQLARAVRRACPPWLGNRVEDLAQKAALRVVERSRRAANESQLCATYLHRVAYSVVIDEIRALRRREHVQMAMPDDEGASRGPAAHDDDPERSADRRRLGSQIVGCLNQMSPDRRSALTLSLQGYSVPESAALLGWNRKRTENLTCRARADLRRWLVERGIAP